MVNTPCTEMNYALQTLFGSVLETWHDFLDNDYSELIHVDGEEGDFGIVKHFDKTVLMMVTYVKGGDVESSYYTAEGIAKVKQLLLSSMSDDNIDPALSTGLNPPEGCYGFTMGCDIVQARRNHDAITLRRMRKELQKMREENKNGK